MKGKKDKKGKKKEGIKKEHLLKLIGFAVLALLLGNLLLFALKIITTLLFWVIIGLGAIFVYKFLPKLKKK